MGSIRNSEIDSYLNQCYPPFGQFSQLPVPIELVPALGAENTVSLVQQASTLGGCDCVLVHPELLQDRRCELAECRGLSLQWQNAKTLQNAGVYPYSVRWYIICQYWMEHNVSCPKS